jgi:PAS domain S-box-containing protein
MPKSSDKIHCLINILSQLDCGRRVTASTLSESLNVSERSIYRYLITLQNSGYPIYFNHEEDSYRFADGYNLKKNSDHAEIHQALELKSRMLNSSPIGLLSYDASGQCVVANDAAVGIIGGTRQETLSQNFFNLPSWKSSGLLVAALDVLRTGVERSGDFHIVTTFGREIWIYAVLTYFSQEGAGYLQMVFHDFTERKRMEISLKESESLMSLFIENNPAYTFIKDDNLRFVQVSKNYEQLLGLSVEQIIGRDMTELFPKDLADRIIHDDREILKTGTKREVEEEFMGGYFTTIKFPFERGGRKFLAGFALDITARKLAEIGRKQVNFG